MNIRTLTFTIFLLLWAALGTALAVVPPYTSLPLAWDKAPSHGTNISFVLKWGHTNGSTEFSTNVGHKFTAIVTNPTPGISLSSVGGNTGPIGNPGAGGFGGSRKSCPWPLTNRAGGKQGSPGSFERGQHGRNGVIRFYEVPKTESHRLFEALDAAKLLETE